MRGDGKQSCRNHGEFCKENCQWRPPARSIGRRDDDGPMKGSVNGQRPANDQSMSAGENLSRGGGRIDLRPHVLRSARRGGTRLRKTPAFLRESQSVAPPSMPGSRSCRNVGQGWFVRVVTAGLAVVQAWSWFARLNYLFLGVTRALNQCQFIAAEVCGKSCITGAFWAHLARIHPIGPRFSREGLKPA
jgi:hypothetical protein